MATEIRTQLAKKSTKELLHFDKEILRKYLKSDKYAGYEDFQHILLELGSNYTEFEQHLCILKTPFGKEPLDKKGRPRVLVQKLLHSYTQDSDPVNGTPAEKKEALERYGRQKARDYFEETIEKVVNLVKYKIDFDTNTISGGTHSKRSDETLFYFKCYYWFENDTHEIRNVKTGFLKIKCINPDLLNKYKIEYADLEIFSSNSENEGTVKMVAKAADIINQDGIIYTFFKNEGDEKILSQITINVSRDLPIEWKYITGVYSTIGPGKKLNPIVGLLILERINGKADYDPSVDKIPPVFYNYLHRTRAFAMPNVFEKIEQHPSFREVDLLQKYAGYYSGVYFNKTKGSSNKPEDSVDHFLFHINKNGEATLHHPDIDRPYLGRVRVLKSKNDALMAYLDYLIREHTYRFTIYFNKKFKGTDRKHLYAVYAGIEREDPFVPTAGRMIFKKLEGDVKNQEEAKYVYSEKSVDFMAASQNKQYVKILRGHDKESNYFEELPSFTRLSGDTESLEMPYTGTFYTYYLSTTQARVYKVPLRINGDGTVEMKPRQNNTKIHRGHAIYNGSDRLSIYLEKANQKNTFFHILFAMGNSSLAENGSHFFGVSSKIDYFNSPAARMEILVREDFEFEKATSKTFKIDSDEYDTEDKAQNGILSYLTGRANRIVVTKKTVDADFIRSNDHYEYFYAACYLSKKAEKKEDYEAALKYLYQAYLHGYGKTEEEIELLDKELENCFKLAITQKVKAKPDLSKLPEMTFKTIIKKIQNRFGN